MYYKQDWDKAKERILAWWEGEIIDRCVVGVHALRKTSKMTTPFPEQHNGPWLGGLEKFDNDQEAIVKWWTDPEENYNRMITWFENNYFGGEAIPCTYVNWGAMAMSSFYGSEPYFSQTTVWYPETIHDWDNWEWKFDPKTDKYWNIIKAITKCFLERNEGRYFIGTPELGNGGDVLSLMRGMGQLSIDLIEEPEPVKKAVDIISDTWVELVEEVYNQTYEANDNGGVLAWMGIWAPGRTDQIACDYSIVISPQHFQEFFVPEILKMGNWSEYGVYHLDGPQCMQNMLDTILEIEQIHTIQWTPGVGSPPTYSPQYMPKYRKILESGRQLYLLAKAKDIEGILSELPTKGLYLRTDVDTEDEANDLLKKVERWSVKGNQVSMSNATES